MMRIAAFKRQQTQRSRRRSRRLQIQLEATDGVIASRTKSSRATTTLQQNHFDLDLDLSSPDQTPVMKWNSQFSRSDQTADKNPHENSEELDLQIKKP